MQAHELVDLVQDKYKGLTKTLSEITEKGEAWWRSHRRTPKTEDPTENGNVSAVTHFIRFCKLYETAQKGAGRYLIELVYVELKCAFSDGRDKDCTLRELRHSVLGEATDVLKALDECDLSEAKKEDLIRWKKEGIELKTAADFVIEQIERELKKREIRSKVFVGIDTDKKSERFRN